MPRSSLDISVPAAALLVACGAVSALPADVRPMTRERIAEAVEAGSKPGDALILYEDVCRTSSSPGAYEFSVVITTPFGLVADTVFESRKRGEPLDVDHMSIEPPEKQSVIVSVDPVLLFGEGPLPPPVSVRSVFLRRGAERIEPRRADTHDVHFPDPGKSDRTCRGGAYYFPPEPFGSDKGDLEIVVIPESDKTGLEAVLKLKKSALAKMR